MVPLFELDFRILVGEMLWKGMLFAQVFTLWVLTELWMYSRELHQAFPGWYGVGWNRGPYEYCRSHTGVSKFSLENFEARVQQAILGFLE